MRRLWELAGVALGGLRARKVRTALIMLGPILGVAAIVSAIGINESSKGHLKAVLSDLGTDLIVANAQGSLGGFGSDPRIPEDAAARVTRLPDVESVTGTLQMADIVTLPFEEAEDFYRAFPVPVIATGLNLPETLEVLLASGRFLNDFDVSTAARVVVIGRDLADEYGYLRGEARTIQLNGIDYGVVGVLDYVLLEPSMDSAVFLTFANAEEDLGLDSRDPSRLYIRAPTNTKLVAQEVPTVISLGGPDGANTSVPTDLLDAQSQVDENLNNLTKMMGGLALIVGGVGIANVMSISVIQRSTEIGIRRALGHSRGTIAVQFLLEALVVGVLGGILGAAAGAGVVWLTAELRGYVMVLSVVGLVGWAMVSVAVAVVAGLYPSTKAARLEPLETLRLG
ncbi:MAG: ABC transporter permease [Acidimicrobiales bacterium]|nr:ABC transporter permease [Acidimicrobiales bacterium]MDP7118403.1 ABC transporter permease [Acidimicrobiales bacterium]MDP7411768.1 ABC transporter permease [Acidimicrobiales bacterium]MEE1522067.1 ABC transporter permease [Acidimicrobiales bacterium]MEE1570778.1 ABC transporter permease [Acidimicrobiales bacterium]